MNTKKAKNKPNSGIFMGKKKSILQNMHGFNRDLIQLEQLIPELKNLHIHLEPENEVLVDEMETRVKSLEAIKGQYTSRCEELAKQKEDELKLHQTKKQKLKELTELIAEHRRRIEEKLASGVALKQEFTQKEEKLKAEAEDWSDKVTKARQQIKVVEGLRDHKASLKQRLLALHEARDHAKEQEVCFWKRFDDRFQHVPARIEFVKEQINQADIEVEHEENTSIEKLRALYGLS